MISAALQSLEMNPAELAQLTQHSTSTILRYRAGKSTPSRVFCLDLFDAVPDLGFTLRQIASPLGYRWVGSCDPRKFRRFGEFFSSVRIHEGRNREYFGVKLGVPRGAVRDVEHGYLPDDRVLNRLVQRYLMPALNVDDIRAAFPVLRPSDDELRYRESLLRIRELRPDDVDRKQLEEEFARELLPVAEQMARKAGWFYGRQRDAEEVCGEALWLAMKRQDPRRGLFLPYLKIVVRSLVRELNRMGMQSGVAAVLRDYGLPYKEAISDLTQQFRRDPTEQEIAEYLDLPEKVVFDVARAFNASFAKSSGDLEYYLNQAVQLRSYDDPDLLGENGVTQRLRRLPESLSELLYMHYHDRMSVARIAKIVELREDEVELKLLWAVAQLGGLNRPPI